jgi:signal transduction histidine kinase
MVARIELEPERAPSHTGSRDVPWETTPHGWLRRLVLVRSALLIPIGGLLVYRLFTSVATNASLAFGALLAAAVGHAIAFRLGGRRDAAIGTANLACTVSFLIDLGFVAGLAAATGGIGSPFVAAYIFVVLAARFVLAPIPALAITLAAILSVLALGIGGGTGADTAASATAAAIAAAGAIVVAHAAAAWCVARLHYLEGRAAAAERESGGGSVADWDELPVAERPLEGGVGTIENWGALGAIATQISHELRDPAGMIRARAESLRYELRDRSRRDDLLPEIERLLRSADRLEDVRLTLATLGGALRSTREDCDPRSLFDEVRNAFQTEFERDGVRLRFDAPRTLPAVGLTHNELRLVIVRWIEAGRRAALAHGRNARIVARFSVSEGTVILEVEDALPIAAAPDPAMRPDADDDKRPGLGLALAVARLLVEPRGGRCETDLRRGGGLVLRARLPKAANR